MRIACAALIGEAVESIPAGAQVIAGIGPDSVEVVAARGFAAGGLHRGLLGNNYRDLWTLPIRVPVLHIDQFDGGLTPYKLGGGNQTVSLRMLASDSMEYVFRPIYKSGIRLPDEFRGTVVWWLFRDAWSASHPGANVATVPLLDAFGLLNPHAQLVFMPDDPKLGEFRKLFAGVLGTIEQYPAKPKVGRAFANAVEVLDAEGLLEAINKDPANQVDARTFLRVRLLDLLVGDNDRHADQWRWARLAEGGPFLPIARDRDKVFVSYEGKLLDLARIISSTLVRFDTAYSSPKALFENATDFDRRLLGGLDRTIWESTARELQGAVTNELIDRVIAAFPREYAARSSDLAAKLRYRRDHLPEAALEYFTQLSVVAEVHATDASDIATVTRNPDGSVDVTLQSETNAPWFKRHYDPRDTREVRIYLHEGDDRATVTGSAPTSIPVRLVGGNGTNTLIDQSLIGGQANATRFYDEGTVNDVKYGRDVVLEKSSYVDALNEYYNRRPLVHAYGRNVFPGRDYGSKIKPIVGLKTGHGLGLVPKVGVARYAYGFRKEPYANMIQADVGFATGTRGWLANLIGDRRFASSDVHVGFAGRLSQIEVIQFRGLGNDVEEDDDPFFDVNQTQWSFRPTAGFTFAPGGDVTLGPIARYTKTDSTANNFISSAGPYGFSSFKQAGIQLALNFDSRTLPDTAKPRFVLELTGNVYPAIWDVNEAYESIEGVAAAFVTIPVLTKPVIAVRGGGKKLYGSFPYFDAAFLGGGSSYRTEHRQRFAGDASVFGSAEVRVPLFTISTIVPTGIGLLAFTDAGRVYVDGESPGGWHTASGGGAWISAIKPAWNVSILYTTNENRRLITSLGFAY